MRDKRVVVLGDSFINTLGLIRSFGEKRIKITLILVGESDRLYVAKSRYVDRKSIYRVENIEQSLPILLRIANCFNDKQWLVCSNDPAISFVDRNEAVLNELYITPTTGKKIGKYLEKDSQCELARECGFIVPRSTTYHVGDKYKPDIDFPIFCKPLNSVKGDKSDMHICYNENEFYSIMEKSDNCRDYIIQEYIAKETEINALGVSIDKGVILPGAVEKTRYPFDSYEASSFGEFRSIDKYGFDLRPLHLFMEEVGYKGLFSIEMLVKDNKYYFLEVNFRSDRMTYASTSAGANLPSYLIEPADSSCIRVKDIYVMDLSLDYLLVKDGTLCFKDWICDFIKTRCQLSFNILDPMPTVYYYIEKIKRRLSVIKCKS